MKSQLLKISMVLIICFGSCKTKKEPSPSIPSEKKYEAVSDKGVSGKRLASVPVGEDQEVNFYEFSPGELGVRHSYAYLDDDEQMSSARISSIDIELEESIKSGQPFYKIYESLSSNPNPKVIEELKAAQERHDQFENVLEAKRALEGTFADKEEIEINDKIVENISSNLRSEHECSSDYYNDNYGARWFLERYCVEGAFRLCFTNLTQYKTSKAISSKWLKASAMAADFNEPVAFRGTVEYYNCSWYHFGTCPRAGFKPIFDYDILPRRVETWFFSNTTLRNFEVNHRISSHCTKAHFSVLYN